MLVDAQRMPSNGSRKPCVPITGKAPSAAEGDENWTATPLRQIEGGDCDEGGGIAEQQARGAEIRL